MVVTGWLAGLTKTDTDKAVIWRDICIVRHLSPSSLSTVSQVQTSLYVLAAAPLLATDTNIWNL